MLGMIGSLAYLVPHPNFYCTHAIMSVSSIVFVGHAIIFAEMKLTPLILLGSDDTAIKGDFWHRMGRTVLYKDQFYLPQDSIYEVSLNV